MNWRRWFGINGSRANGTDLSFRTTPQFPTEPVFPDDYWPTAASIPEPSPPQMLRWRITEPGGKVWYAYAASDSGALGKVARFLGRDEFIARIERAPLDDEIVTMSGRDAR